MELDPPPDSLSLFLGVKCGLWQLPSDSSSEIAPFCGIRLVLLSRTSVWLPVFYALLTSYLRPLPGEKLAVYRPAGLSSFSDSLPSDFYTIDVLHFLSRLISWLESLLACVFISCIGAFIERGVA